MKKKCERKINIVMVYKRDDGSDEHDDGKDSGCGDDDDLLMMNNMVLYPF